MESEQRPVLLDTDAIILLLSWEIFEKTCKALGDKLWIAEFVVDEEVKFYVDRARKRHFVSLRSPRYSRLFRLVSEDDLTDLQHDAYLRYVTSLEAAGPGEKETFALAWALNCDVCSQDTNARPLFYEFKPEDSPSRHILLLPLLRKLRLIS